MITTKDRKYISDIKYKTADDFLHAISYDGELYKLFEHNFIFRGHSSDKYKLQPYALREKLYYKKNNPDKEMTEKAFLYAESEFSQVYCEYWLLEDFFKKCDENGLFVPEVRRMRELMPWNTNGASFLFDRGIWLPEELYELATLAQHHGVPTRLLDWTQDIVIALYFAVSGALQRKYNPQKLTYRQWQQVFFKSLACVKDYHFTKNTLKNEEENYIEIWALDTSIIIVNMKENPLRIIHPRYFDNGNLGAQKGILTLWEIEKPLKKNKERGLVPELKLWEPKTLDEQISEFLAKNNVEEKTYLYRIKIPESEILPLYSYVKHCGCDAAHLFPGYDGVVKCMQEDDIVKYSYKK